MWYSAKLATDEIDRLVDRQLVRGNRDCTRSVGQPFCELCGGQWHGAPGDHDPDWEANGRMRGCPGAFATDEQRERWLRNGHVPFIEKWRETVEAIRRGADAEDIIRSNPVPANFCELCGEQWHAGPAGDNALFIPEEGLIPDCPGASGSAEEREQWLGMGYVCERYPVWREHSFVDFANCDVCFLF